MRYLSLLCMGALGCGGASTTMVLQVAAGDPVPMQGLVVSVFDPHRALLERKPLSSSTLPGTAVVTGLQAGTPLRIAVAANNGVELGWARVVAMAGTRVGAAVTLASNTTDRDGDWVPDAIDNCPTVPNPDQADQLGLGVGDACRGDGGTVVTPSLCPSSTFLLCDGFEGPSLDPRWTAWLINGSVALDPTRAYRGTSSLRAHIDAMNGRSHATIFAQPAMPRPNIYVRAFVYVQSAPAVPTEVLTLIQNQNPWLLSEASLEAGTVSTDAEGVHQLGATFPLNRWFCVNWQLFADATNGGLYTFVDGVPGQPLLGQNTSPTPFYAQLRIGANASTNVPIDVWIDEIALDPNPIPCDK